MQRTTSAAGIGLIKEFEHCCLQAYPDPRYGEKVPTIGWGDTGPDVHMGMEITQDEADRRLARKIEGFESILGQHLTAAVNQNQWDALVSFLYNVGPGAPGQKDGLIWLADRTPRHSTLLIRVNTHQYAAAADEFLKWDKSGGAILTGLARRRSAERALFLA